jgi:hypothetical protein
MSTSGGDSAAASVHVALGIADAFEVFTVEIDLWWRHGRKYRIAGKRPGRAKRAGRREIRLTTTASRGS